MDWFDAVAQTAVAGCGLIGLFLVTKKSKWGFIWGLSAQPFWFYTSYHHRQWGIFLLTLAYTIVWAHGAYTWFRDERTQRGGEKDGVLRQHASSQGAPHRGGNLAVPGASSDHLPDET